ncbi:nuclear transport factor 2 family protein [Phenylobacterium sp.]|uniref:nuclear transport factor 2 family protein n=1 Tax=Phenylobacterium sp. TaxID=1871053 RepID=UPI0035B064D6
MRNTGHIIKAALGGLAVSAAVLAMAAPAAAQNTAALEKRIAALEARVQTQEDIEAINKLTRAYGYYIDKQVWSEVTPLFSDDAVVEISGRGVYKGRKGVETLFQKVIGRNHEGLMDGSLSNHMVLQGIVNVDPGGKTASGRWRAFIQIGIYQKAALWAEGPYEITYVKENGVWKFKTMHWFGTYFTPFDQGWAKMSFGNNGPSKDFPPDAPPSIKYDAFPGHFVPPFHYPNPVTGRPWTMEDSRKYSTEGMDPSAAANAPSANSPLAAPAAPRQ